MAEYRGTIHSDELPNGCAPGRLVILYSHAVCMADGTDWRQAFSYHGARFARAGGVQVTHLSYPGFRFVGNATLLRNPVLRSHPSTAPQIVRLSRVPLVWRLLRIVSIFILTIMVGVVGAGSALQSVTIARWVITHLPPPVLHWIGSCGVVAVVEQDGMVADGAVRQELASLVSGQAGAPQTGGSVLHISRASEMRILGLPNGEVVLSAGLLLDVGSLETLMGVIRAGEERLRSQECLEDMLRAGLFWKTLRAVVEGRVSSRAEMERVLGRAFLQSCTRTLPATGGVAADQVLADFQTRLRMALGVVPE